MADTEEKRNGSVPPLSSQDEMAHLTATGAVLTWDDLSHDERLALLADTPDITFWTVPEAIEALTYARHHPEEWLRLCTRYKQLGGLVYELRKAVDMRLQLDRLAAQSAATPGAGPRGFGEALVSYADLLTVSAPPRDPYFDWLTTRALVMVYGACGVGKTMALLGLSLSIALEQPFLKWPCYQPGTVLYVDGELPLNELRKRTRQLAQGAMPASLHFLPSELVYTTTGRDLTLTAEANRQELEALLTARPDIQVLVLDNISCLFPGINEDKKQEWEPINAWLIRLRHRGLTVILGHHAGKSGQQRGTSGREDALDTVIALHLPAGYQPQDGCHFTWRFEKARSIHGETLEPLDIRVEHTGDALTWTWRPLDVTRTQRLHTMLTDGMPPKLVAEELGVSASYVYKYKKDHGL